MDSSCNTNAQTLCDKQNPKCPYCCCGLGPDPVDGKDVTICCAPGVACDPAYGCKGSVYTDYDYTKCNGNSYCGQKLIYDSSTKGYKVLENICCSNGYVCCGGKCCPNGNCKDVGNGKICCPNSTDTVCNNQCCASGICCGKNCCSKDLTRCVDGNCCPSIQNYCDPSVLLCYYAAIVAAGSWNYGKKTFCQCMSDAYANYPGCLSDCLKNNSGSGFNVC